MVCPFYGSHNGSDLKLRLNNSIAHGTVLELPAGTYTGSCGTTVTSQESKMVLVRGLGRVIIDCEGADRFLYLLGQVHVTLENVEVRNGRNNAQNDKGGCIKLEKGAGLTLYNSTIKNCSSAGNGGGVSLTAAGQLEMRGASVISNCEARVHGGQSWFHSTCVSICLFSVRLHVCMNWDCTL